MLDSVFISVLNMSLVASYVTLFVLIARLLFKKAPKIFSYVLWAVVLVRLLCPFSFESTISLLPNTITNNTIVSEFTDDYVGTINIYHDNTNEYKLALEQGIEPISAGEGGYYVVTGVDGISQPDTILPILTNIWLIGIAVMVVYSVISLLKLRRKLIGATPLDKNIYIADHIDSPFVMGFIRPKMYLPSNLSDTERAFIISHEQTHIKRLDHITRILSFIALAVHWFNPLVWIAFVLSGKDMETSCDESVMKKMNTDIRADYSEALLKFATGKKLIAATPLAFGEGDTKGRVKNVMKYKKPVVWVSAICLILVSMVAVALMSNAKNDEQDLSLLNPTTLKNSVYQLENYVTVTAEDGSITEVFPKIIANFLDDDKLKRKNMDLIELIPTYTFDINSVVVSLYEFEPDLVKLHFSDIDEYRYYTKDDIYNEFISILNSDITEFEAIEIGTPKEQVREKFGEPDTYGNWNYDEIYLLTDAQITISYSSDSETNSFVEKVNINTHARLSLNDIIMLSQKGEDLTWADFEKYPYIQTGSGLNIRIYDINDMFTFSIGGGATDDEPMYMALSAKIENEPSIDIRTDDVTEFISKYNTAISANVDGKVDTIQVILAGGNPAYGNKSKTITEPSEVEAFINAFDTFDVNEDIAIDIAIGEPSYYRLYDGDKLVEEYMFNGNDSTAMWIGQFVKLVEYEGKSPYELYEQSTAEEVIVYQDSDYTKAADLAKLFIEDKEQNKILDYAQPKVEKLTITNTHKIFDLEFNELFDIDGQTVYKVTFETEDDDILGPIVCYVDAGSFTVLGIDARR